MGTTQGICGGHHYWKETTSKILRVGFYWPSVFSDVFSKVRSYPKCQKFAGKETLLSLPWKPISVEAPFQQ